MLLLCKTNSSSECNKVVSAFWSLCRRCRFVVKFLLFFIVFRHLISFTKADMPTSGNTNLYFEAHKPVFCDKNLYFLKTYTNRLPLPYFITRIFTTSIVIHFMPHCPFSPHYCGVSQLQCAVLCRIFHLQQCWNQRNTTYTFHGFLPSLTALWSPSCANTPPRKYVFFYFWTPSHL